MTPEEEKAAFVEAAKAHVEKTRVAMARIAIVLDKASAEVRNNPSRFPDGATIIIGVPFSDLEQALFGLKVMSDLVALTKDECERLEYTINDLEYCRKIYPHSLGIIDRALGNLRPKT